MKNVIFFSYLLTIIFYVNTLKIKGISDNTEVCCCLYDFNSDYVSYKETWWTQQGGECSPEGCYNKVVKSQDYCRNYFSNIGGYYKPALLHNENDRNVIRDTIIYRENLFKSGYENICCCLYKFDNMQSDSIKLIWWKAEYCNPYGCESNYAYTVGDQKASKKLCDEKIVDDKSKNWYLMKAKEKLNIN